MIPYCQTANTQASQELQSVAVAGIQTRHYSSLLEFLGLLEFSLILGFYLLLGEYVKG
jgi:hypothetical protein